MKKFGIVVIALALLVVGMAMAETGQPVGEDDLLIMLAVIGTSLIYIFGGYLDAILKGESPSASKALATFLFGIALGVIAIILNVEPTPGNLTLMASSYAGGLYFLEKFSTAFINLVRVKLLGLAPIQNIAERFI